MLNLYTETAFEASHPTIASRIELQIPRANGSYLRSKHSVKEKRTDNLATDEKSYVKEYLASASAIYFRESKTYPRSFLWRVVSNETVLEVKCADFARSAADPKEAYLTLAFGFQDKISPRGVTFADYNTANAIRLFVLTGANEVFELHLSTDFFRDADSIPPEVSKWCHPVHVSSLSIDTVYRISATTPSDLLVSFISGRVQSWKRDNVGEQWKQNNYDERTWSASLLSIVGRKGYPDVDFEGLRLAYNTSHAMTASATHLYTLCLNHTLKVWNLQNGTLVDSRDLLDVAREPQERIQLNPAESGYIQLLTLPGSSHQILAAYSPHLGGQFKFWRVQNKQAESHVLEDMFPSATLAPPDPDSSGNTVWALAGVEIAFDRNTKDWTMWILWRNHNYHQLYTLSFNFPSLLDAWQQNWIHSTSLSIRDKAPDFIPPNDQDPTSKWLEHLLFPGRYSMAVLETGLTRYQALTDTKIPSNLRSKSFTERICSVIASDVPLRKDQDSQIDYDRFSIDTDQQWRNFWRIVESMNEDRYAPLTLCYDSLTDTPWITMTDMCCVVRECSDLEILQHTAHDKLLQLETVARERWPHRKVNGNLQGLEDAACLLQASNAFIQSFSPELFNSLLTAIDESLYAETEEATPERIINIYNEIDLANAVSADAEAEFTKNLASMGGVDGVKDELFDAIFSLLTARKRKTPDSELIKTVFGSQLVSSAIVEEIARTNQLLLSLIVLTIFVDESEAFQASRYFDNLLQRLHSTQRNLWLCTHYRRVPLEFRTAARAQMMTKKGTPDADNTRTISIMQDLFGNAVPPQPAVNIPVPYLITTHIAENLNFISGDDHLSQDDAAVRLQCNLIRSGDLNFALDFHRFQPITSWSMYVQARLQLALGNFDPAALYFRQASFNLAHGKAIGQLSEMSDGLVPTLDAEGFNNGSAKYFQHVMTLFEKEKAYSHTADFARLALQSLEPRKEPTPQFQQEILARLFTAELKCSRFKYAYEALIQFEDPALQKTSANALVNAMLNPKSSLSNGSGLLDDLQRLPWSLHPQLESQLDAQLATLAKSQTALPGHHASTSSVDYLSILYALRLSKQDYRGAVAVLFDRLRIVQRSARARHDPQATALRHSLLALINVMTCVAPEEAYVLVDVDDDPRMQAAPKVARTADQNGERPRKRRRIIITLDDLRREYQMVLDKCNRIERGDFGFDTVENNDSEDEEDSHQLVHVNGDSMEMS